MDKRNPHGKGFTLIELIVVVGILVSLIGIAVPKLSGAMEKTRVSADKATLRTLNHVTNMYKAGETIFDEDVFAGIDENEDRILSLVDKGYLLKEIRPQGKNASFNWNISEQIWELYVGDNPIQLSPLGNNFEEISGGMISLILKRYVEQNSYGRTWGDYRYTDLGLDPEDWKEPILNMKYTPSGSQLLISPEKGYKFKIKNDDGEIKTVLDVYNLIYETKTSEWYYHSIKPENIVNIDTLEIIN